MRRILVIGLLCCYVFGLAGCASLKEGVRQFLGVSTKEVENVRDNAIVKVVNYDYDSCYQRIEQRLKEIGSYIYSKRRDLIAVYASKTDTTPAGIFFKEISKKKTELSIASPASDTKEYLAEKIFAVLK